MILSKFSKFVESIGGPKKVLLLDFNMDIDTHGFDDTKDFFFGNKKSEPTMVRKIQDKLPGTEVDCLSYSDIYRTKSGFYINGVNLKEYNFVLFGLISKRTTLVKLVVNYLNLNKVPYMSYGTYVEYDNKAYEFDLIESLGYPYIPSVMTSKLNKNILSEIEGFKYPVIVKGVTGARGEDVHKADNELELQNLFNWGNGLKLIQKFVPNDGDYRVIVIKNKVEVVVKRKSTKSDEFRNNLAMGGTAEKGELPTDVISMCEDVSSHLHCDIVGFDIIQDMTTKEYYIMETNAGPHFATFAVVSGVDVLGLVANHIIKEIDLFTTV